jgi:hypothetical protein
MKELLGKLEWWHVAAGVLAVGAGWRALGAPAATRPAGDEDIQLQARAYTLPDEFFHFSPVSWAGRQHPYPRGVGQGIAALMTRSAPDWADCDR